MPQFYTGEVKTARVTLTNPKQMATTYNGMLFMGAGLAGLLVGETAFSLGVGQTKEVTFSAVMPSAAGTYPVYLGIFYGNALVQLFKASQDVTVALAGIDLGDLQILSVEGRGFSSVGPGYGVLTSPIEVPNLRGMTILWKNINIEDFLRAGYSANEYVQWLWQVYFEPEFDATYWVEGYYEIREGPGYAYEEWIEGYWTTPGWPSFRNVRNLYPGMYPAIGEAYQVDIKDSVVGGESLLPGVYGGLFLLSQTFMGGMAIRQDVIWRVKNMMRVV